MLRAVSVAIWPLAAMADCGLDLAAIEYREKVTVIAVHARYKDCDCRRSYLRHAKAHPFTAASREVNRPPTSIACSGTAIRVVNPFTGLLNMRISLKQLNLAAHA